MLGLAGAWAATAGATNTLHRATWLKQGHIHTFIGKQQHVAITLALGPPADFQSDVSV